MVTAIVLIRADRALINDVAQQLSDLQGISEVYSLSGQFDLAAIARVKTNESLAGLVTNHMVKVKGIISTETMLAFRCFSKHDLEAMFSLGD